MKSSTTPATLILGCMAYRGKYDQQNNQVYVKFSDWKKICNMLTAITPRTITEHRKALEKLGYITEDAAAHRWIVANYYEGRKCAAMYCGISLLLEIVLF